jgi:CheY-like chemotaxis protein
MTQILILCVEDEPEVRDALIRDLAPFAEVFPIEEAEDVDDARQALASAYERGLTLGLILCDHLLPGASGVDFLVELHADPHTAAARKVLVTGQAGLEDTVRAVNRAGLDHYIAKPWTAQQLADVVRTQLTEFVLETQEDVLPFVTALDGPRLLDALRNRNVRE